MIIHLGSKMPFSFSSFSLSPIEEAELICSYNSFSFNSSRSSVDTISSLLLNLRMEMSSYEHDAAVKTI